MLVREIMKSNVECVAMGDSARHAASRMRELNIGFLPICDEQKRVLGTITDRDLALRVVAENRTSTTPMSELISEEKVVTCAPDDDVKRAAQIMQESRKSRLVCVDRSGKLVGMVSLSDLSDRVDGVMASETMRAVSRREVQPH